VLDDVHLDVLHDVHLDVLHDVHLDVLHVHLQPLFCANPPSYTHPHPHTVAKVRLVLEKTLRYHNVATD